MHKYESERWMLYEALVHDELLEQIVECYVPGIFGFGNGIAVATDRRLLALKKGKRITSIEYVNIGSVTEKFGIISASIRINCPGMQELILDQIANQDTVTIFTDYVQNRLNSIARDGSEERSEKQSNAQRIDERWEVLRLKYWGNMHVNERKLLYNLLDADEYIERLTAGTYRADTHRLHKHMGIGIATTKRVIFYDVKKVTDGEIDDQQVSEIPYHNIEAITYTSGILAAGIQITGRSIAGFRIEDILWKETVKPFVDCVQSHLETVRKPQPSVQATASVVFIADEVEKLANLLQKGILTQDEFDTQKKLLLGI